MSWDPKSPFHLDCPEDGGSKLLHHVGNCMPIDKPHPKRVNRKYHSNFGFYLQKVIITVMLVNFL